MRLLALTALLLLTHPAWAADMSPPSDISSATADALATLRRLIAAKDWAGALAALRAQPQAANADWNNLMGYTLRKQVTPDLAKAETYYLEALRIDPGHRGANEYLGELYLMKGDVAGAEKRLAALAQLCPGGCEEREDLARAISASKAKKS